MVEVYLTKPFVSHEDWLALIQIISKYQGILRKWKIIVTIQQNQIRYFIQTKYSLPPTLPHLNAFLFKNISDICLPSVKSILPFFTKIDCNLLDIINSFEIRNKGKVSYLEITFLKLRRQYILNHTSFYIDRDNSFQKYHLLLSLPAFLLAIDFAGSKRYFYKNAPKYLDIYKMLPFLSPESPSSLLKVDTFPYLQEEYYLNQSHYSFDKHSAIIGSSGSGKSKFISLLIHNIYKSPELKSKYKIVVIDPHASLEEDIGGFSRVIDFKNRFDSIDLFMNQSDDIVSATELLLELLQSLLLNQYNSKLERILRHSIYVLLADESFSFRNLRKFLLDSEYRTFLLKHLKSTLNTSVIEFFLSDFNDLKAKYYGEAISPIISFIDEMEMIPVFQEQTDLDNLKDTIQNHFLTLFSLDRIHLGERVIKTISGLIMQQLFMIVQRRSITEHILLVVDEVAVVENPILSRFLSEARKYNLSFILIGQYFNQISDSLKSSIFANVVNYYIFRVSKLDASILVDNFNMKVPLDDTRETKIKLLTELGTRECIARIGSEGVLLPAFKASTVSYVSVPRLKNYSNSSMNRSSGSKNTLEKKRKFTVSNQVKLKDVLIANSSSRKVVK